MVYYITGDTHNDFRRFFKNQTINFDEEDVAIILGDAGFNYYVYESITRRQREALGNDTNIRRYRSDGYSQQGKSIFMRKFPGTVFCIHGNHEARPSTIEGYKQKEWNGGLVWYEEEFPRLLFAVDGEVYRLNGKDYIVIGGAYSMDKYERLRRQEKGELLWMWFDDEQPDDAIKQYVEKTLEKHQWKIHGVFSHTCPYKYMPQELFLSNYDQSSVDDCTERWLDEIEEKLTYDIWYFGHFHGNRTIDKMQMLFEDIRELK